MFYRNCREKLGELQRKHPEFFKKAHKSALGNGIETFVNLKFPEGICHRNNITNSITNHIFNDPDDTSFSKSKVALNELLGDLDRKISLEPKITNTSGSGYTSKNYIWSNGNKNVSITAVFMTNLKQGSVTLSVNDLSFFSELSYK